MPDSLPPGASEDEVAQWFAEMDLSQLDLEDVSDEEPKDSLPRPKGMSAVSLRLPNWEIEEIRLRAEHIGIGYTTYIRMLVHRHVRSEETHPLGG